MAGLNDNRRGAPEPFPVHVEDARFVVQLKSHWKTYKRSESTKMKLIRMLEESSNPYDCVLQLIESCEDLFHNKSNTLAAYVLEIFSSWAAENEHQILHHLTVPIKEDAFKTITMQKNGLLMKTVILTFKIHENSLLFLDKVKNMLLLKRYKEACQCAMALNVVDKIPLDDMILPLILQDKVSIAEEALQNHVELQHELLTRLDSILGERSHRSTMEHLINQLDVPEVKMERFLQYKPFLKLVGKLFKSFNAPPEVCPNLNKKRSEGALHFIIHKRFVDKTLSVDSWREMVCDAVKDNPNLQMELMMSVNQWGHPEEALFWAHEFNIPEKEWPYQVQELHRRNPGSRLQFPGSSNAPETEESWDEDNLPYYSLRLPDSAIVMVDSELEFRNFLDLIRSMNEPLVGIDSEWKPAFGTQKNELALVQLAINDRVFILDIIKIPGMSNVWNEAVSVLFENCSVTKLGFGLSTDLTMMKNAIPALSNIKLNGAGYLDLATLWRRLLQNYEISFPYAEDNQSNPGESLAKLVFICFGQHLDKSDQLSNWEQRPLRQKQLRYAALDAFVLLDLYSFIEELCNKQRIPFLEVCDEIMLGFRSPKRSSLGLGRGRGWSRPSADVDDQEKPFTSKTPTTVQGLKFSVDNMLFGLGRQLRKCGVDCLELPSRKTDQKEFQCSLLQIREEERIILSQGTCLARLQNDLTGYTNIYNVPNAKSLADQLKWVLKFFNILVRKDDVFSRCQICNSNRFTMLSKDAMSLLARQSDSGSSLAPLLAMRGFDRITSTPIRTWTLSSAATCSESGLTSSGARIQVEVVPQQILSTVQLFYVCDGCGKVFWEGSHLERALNGKVLRQALQDGHDS